MNKKTTDKKAYYNNGNYFPRQQKIIKHNSKFPFLGFLVFELFENNMNRYVITKSMNRIDCCNLMLKIKEEIFEKNILNKLDKELTKGLNEKKKSRLLGNKKYKDKIYTVADKSYKGVSLYILKPEKIGFIIIYNISPIDAPYVQYMWIGLDNRPIIITQHLLDRYNERILKSANASYKELIICFSLNSIDRYGNHIAIDSDTNKIIQRIDGGFIFGVEHNDYDVFNTIYESIEGKDSDLKSLARNIKVNWDEFSPSQKVLYERFHKQLIEDAKTEEEFSQ